MTESDTVTCFVSENLYLHDSESDLVACFLSVNLGIRECHHKVRDCGYT
jgi:hypothetical protein